MGCDIQKWMRSHIEDRLRKCIAIDPSDSTAAEHLSELGIRQDLSNSYFSVPSDRLVQVSRWNSSSSSLSAVASDSESLIKLEFSPPAEITFRKTIDQESPEIEEGLVLKLQESQIRITDCFSPPRLFLCLEKISVWKTNHGLDFGAPRTLVEQGNIKHLISAYSVWKQGADRPRISDTTNKSSCAERYEPQEHDHAPPRWGSDEGYNSSAELATQALPAKITSPSPRPKSHVTHPDLGPLRDALRKKYPAAPKTSADKIEVEAKKSVTRAGEETDPLSDNTYLHMIASSESKEEIRPSPLNSPSSGTKRKSSSSLLGPTRDDFNPTSKKASLDILVPASSSPQLFKQPSKISSSRTTNVSDSQVPEKMTQQNLVETRPQDEGGVVEQEPQPTEKKSTVNIWNDWRRLLGGKGSFPRHKVQIPRAQENMFGDHSYHPPLPGKNKSKTNIPIDLLTSITNLVDHPEGLQPDEMDVDDPAQQPIDDQDEKADDAEDTDDEEEVPASQWPDSPIQPSCNVNQVTDKHQQSSPSAVAQPPIFEDESDEDIIEVQMFSLSSSPAEAGRLPPDSSAVDPESRNSSTPPPNKDLSWYVQPCEYRATPNAELDLKYKSKDNLAVSMRNAENVEASLGRTATDYFAKTLSRQADDLIANSDPVARAVKAVENPLGSLEFPSAPVSRAVCVHRTPPSESKIHSSPAPPTQEPLTQIPSSPPNLPLSPCVHRKRVLVTSPTKVPDSTKYPRLSSPELHSSLDSQNPTVKSLRKKEEFIALLKRGEPDKSKVKSPGIQNKDPDSPTSISLKVKARYLAELEKADFRAQRSPSPPSLPTSKPLLSATKPQGDSRFQGIKDDSPDPLASASLFTSDLASSSRPPPPPSNQNARDSSSSSQQPSAPAATSRDDSALQSSRPNPTTSIAPATGSKLLDLLAGLGKHPLPKPDPDTPMKLDPSPNIKTQDDGDGEDEDEDEDGEASAWHRASNTPFKLWAASYNALPGVRRENERAKRWQVDLGRWGGEWENDGPDGEIGKRS